MRTITALCCVVLLVASCGTPSESPPASEPTPSPMTTTTIETTTPPDLTTATSSTTTAPPPTTTSPPAEFTAAALGTNPAIPLGATAALGSGCSPGGDELTDGAWFGWLTAVEASSVEFDLACLWPGRLEPAASNDVTRVRRVPVAPDAAVYVGTSPAAPYDDWWAGYATDASVGNAPGLPEWHPYWLFVNDGMITEAAEYPAPVVWARAAHAWPGLGPGCCDGGPVVPASPSDPWPTEGWPADGFYGLWVDEVTDTSYEVTLSKYLSCRENPGMCPEWWIGDEVTSDPEAPVIQRSLGFDETLTVVLTGIPTGLEQSAGPLVGDGLAFAGMLADHRAAAAEWLDRDPPVDIAALSVDPDFPFGIAMLDMGDTGPEAYRGPGGSYLTLPSWGMWWNVLEIRDGLPILYVHAGLIAG